MANLRVSELDFDTIKLNLKNYLKAQNEFTDYDFEGSSLSVLLDILAYNTHYNAYLANMLANEMFLDSAVKRESAVSIAKHLAYTPRSVKCAEAVVDILISSPTGSPTSLTLPRYTPFTTIINEGSFTFLNTEPITITPENGIYSFSNVTLKEGSVFSLSFTVENPGPTEKYEIPDVDVDISTLLISVRTSSTDPSSVVYTRYNNITETDGTSLIYFVEENYKGRFEVYFGDGILGKLLSAGNIVTISYIVSNGSEANVSSLNTQQFSYSGTLFGGTTTVTTVDNSTGGQDKETIDEIKFNAPKAYTSLDRAITANDYKTLIEQFYPLAESIAVWGGEDNIPPKYGKIIISLKPYQGYFVSEYTKNNIKNNLLKNKQVIGLLPEFVDPEYYYVNLDVETKFNSRFTTNSVNDIKTIVEERIREFFRIYLQKFDKDFYLGQLLTYISDADSSILGNLVSLKLQLRKEPLLNENNQYTGDYALKFNNKVVPNTFSSTVFFSIIDGVNTRCIISDRSISNPPDLNGAGYLQLINYSTGAIIKENIGSILYSIGEAELTDFIPVGYSGDQTDIRFTVSLQNNSYDILANKGQILLLDDSTKNVENNRDTGLKINVTAKDD